MKNIVFLLLATFSNFAFAQNYYVSNIVELEKDLTARIKAVKDNDGRGCALIRIDIPSVDGISFDSTIVGTPEYLPGEYNVYVPGNTNTLTFSVEGTPYIIDFPKFNITVEEKKCYRVVVLKKSPAAQNTSKTTIEANYDNVVVMIDGIPVGQTPLQLDNVTLGEHVLSIPNTSGVTMPDTTINFGATNIIKLSLHKETVKPVMVDMATPGGDTANWYQIFGTNVKKENGKQGIVDYAGNIVVPCEFDYVYPGIQNGYYVVTNGGKDGLYEPGKGLVVPCIYDGIVTYKAYTHEAYMPVCQNHKWGVMSPTGDIVVPLEYENYPQICDNAIRVEYKEEGKSNTYGLFSYNGNPIVQPKYDMLNNFINGYAFFMKPDESRGFVDISGNETIIPSKYGLGTWGSEGAILMNGLFRVHDKETRKWGYMNTNLDLVIPAIYDAEKEYDDAPNFNQGIVTLKYNNSKVFLDNKGNVVLNLAESGYKDAEIVCQSGYSWNKGRFFTYSSTDGIVNNTFIKVVNQENQCGLLNVDGTTVVPCKYHEEDIQWFTDKGKNYFVLKTENELLVKDQKQNLLFKLPANLTISEIADGFVMINDEESGSYGYLNLKGEILANCIYGYDPEAPQEETEESEYTVGGYDISCLLNDTPISEGLAILNIGDRYGFIDNKGNIKVPLKYTAVIPFENGISYVRLQDGEWQKIYKKDLK